MPTTLSHNFRKPGIKSRFSELPRGKQNKMAAHNGTGGETTILLLHRSSRLGSKCSPARREVWAGAAYEVLANMSEDLKKYQRIFESSFGAFREKWLSVHRALSN